MKRRVFWFVFFTVFLDCRSTNLLRLFSGNLPAMFIFSCSQTKFVAVIFVLQSFFRPILQDAFLPDDLINLFDVTRDKQVEL